MTQADQRTKGTQKVSGRPDGFTPKRNIDDVEQVVGGAEEEGEEESKKKGKRERKTEKSRRKSLGQWRCVS